MGGLVTDNRRAGKEKGGPHVQEESAETKEAKRSRQVCLSGSERGPSLTAPGPLCDAKTAEDWALRDGQSPLT